MKRLLILSVITLVAGTAGGCRSLSSWCNRGDNCATCYAAEPGCMAPELTCGEGIRTYSSGGMIVAPQGELLPGPIQN